MPIPPSSASTCHRRAGDGVHVSRHNRAIQRQVLREPRPQIDGSGSRLGDTSCGENRVVEGCASCRSNGVMGSSGSSSTALLHDTGCFTPHQRIVIPPSVQDGSRWIRSRRTGFRINPWAFDPGRVLLLATAAGRPVSAQSAGAPNGADGRASAPDRLTTVFVPDRQRHPPESCGVLTRGLVLLVDGEDAGERSRACCAYDPVTR